MRLLAAALGIGFALGALAQGFPTKPVTIVVGFEPGGGTDTTARILQKPLGDQLGQQVVVENRAGAGGNIAVDYVAKAAPDGYMLLLAPSSHVINPSIYAKLPYDTVKDFAPITMVASAAILMAVNPRVPANTMGDFVKAAKADPKAIANYGSAGVGTVFHLTGQMFNELSGLTLQHVPYRGGGPAITDLIAGTVQLGSLGTTPLIPYYKAGTLKLLAQSMSARSPSLSDVPTFQEAGMNGLVVDQRIGVLVPAHDEAAGIAMAFGAGGVAAWPAALPASAYTEPMIGEATLVPPNTSQPLTP